ncbi:Protein kinase domain [Dillenia turbinata]|uniref:Protein kinase domain n=1 Tax=Dillenia turbinata TaxID=194707 RepID=A0AAN8VZ33_9MAGN
MEKEIETTKGKTRFSFLAPMAQSNTNKGRIVGDYHVGNQIGAGSFSVVWHARHRIHGTEVAIKEIVMERLNKKLQDSLMSEIYILKRINHPNIIRLHEIIEVPGRIHIVLEYCKGGDLSMYVRHGRVPEETAKHFMQQLAAGLRVLRDNNLIHRDLKPQNLLLSRNDSSAVLKIADFGFARSLQPRGLAETLCGSPLYMAPEIMQLQKYDAKADLWSVGAILFQLVTGKTPFTGGNQIQLLQNIVGSTELQFPPNSNLSPVCKDLCQKLLRRNPVERLTFEEFFNHPFLSPNQVAESSRSRSLATIEGSPMLDCNPLGNAEEFSQEDCLPLPLEDDSSGPEGSPSYLRRRSMMKSTYGFSLGTKADAREDISTASNNIGLASKGTSVTRPMGNTGFRFDNHRTSDGSIKESSILMDQRLSNQSKVADSLEFIDQDYVLVSGPCGDMSSSSLSASKPAHSPSKSESPLVASVNMNTASSGPMPIIGAGVSNTCCIGSLESQSSAPSGTSQGSSDIGDVLEHPSTDCMTRIKLLQQSVSAIKELVNEKIVAGKQLEAFSIQLVILAIWKQALDICHTQAASAMEGSPTQDTSRLKGSTSKKHGILNISGCPDVIQTQGQEDVCAQIERVFLSEVVNAEELAGVIEPGSTEMPDAMEAIFQSALALGRHGAVEELMGDVCSAAALYSKTVCLLVFLLVEAPSLILNPPFSLTNSERFRLRNYIDVLNNRLVYSRSQKLALPKRDDQQSQT